MSQAIWYVFFYVFGGITLLPASALGVVVFLYFYLPKSTTISQSSAASTKSALDATANDFSFPENENSKNTKKNFSNSIASTPLSIEREFETSVEAHITGWLTVSKEYFSYPTGHPQPEDKVIESAYTSFYKKISVSETRSSAATLVDEVIDAQPVNVAAPRKPKTTKYFAVLRHGNLFLYNNAEQKDVKHVIVIANHLVTIWPPHLPDGALFGKRNSICLLKLPAPILNNHDHALAELLSDPTKPPKDAVYLYSDSNSEKEDFYLALVRASKKHSIHAPPADPSTRASPFNPVYMAHPLQFKTTEMMDLIQTLHSSDANIQTRWLNALLGRLFLAFKDTASFENFFRTKLVNKLARSKRPSFLSEIIVTKVSCGDSIPFFTNPRLVELTPEGKLTVDTDISYNGKFSIEITTNAMINLGARFKTREVQIALSITIQQIEGKMVFRMKPPPSNRLWYNFESAPKIVLRVEPIVSSRSITYSMITKAIESKILEAVSLSKPFFPFLIPYF